MKTRRVNRSRCRESTAKGEFSAANPTTGSPRAFLRVFEQMFLVSAILYHLLFPTPCLADPVYASAHQKRSDFLSRYDPGIPASISLEWDLPSGLVFGLSGGRELHQQRENNPAHLPVPRMTLFPFSFLMTIPLYETPLISQSMGLGVGPCFLHQGQVPIQLRNMEVTGMTTVLTEWVSRLSENVYLNLNMKFTQVFESLQDSIPDRSFVTWLGLKACW